MFDCRYSLTMVSALLIVIAGLASADESQTSDDSPNYTTLSVRGKVVWLAEALERRFGVKSVPEAEDRILALEAADGALYPIVEDIRGRSFRVDKRLRGIELELFVRRYNNSPMIQVIRVYALKKDGKFELDYWCDICAIAMFELKPCDCCQGPIELRERKVDETKK
jgi:hypothetical protein